MNPKRLLLPILLFLGFIGFLASPLPAEASIFLVNTGDDLDDGLCDVSHCSLREAINAANTNPGPDMIHFDVLGSAQVMISLNSPLPALADDGTIIDGASEPDYAGSPNIYLRKAVDVIEVGLSIDSNGNMIRGLGFVSFGAWPEGQSYNYQDLIGGALVVGGSGNLIQDNNIGSGAWWNSVGICIVGPGNSVIGNVISGNGAGVIASHPNSVIQGNIIGPSADGSTAVHNGYGVVLHYGADGTLVGGSAPGEGNLISGSENGGLYSNSDNNEIYGNLIGVDGMGTTALPNDGHGLTVTGENTSIGGSPPGEGNVISGNQFCGIWVNDQGNVIQGNKIGTDISGTIMLPNGWCGIESEADPIVIGGTIPATGNLIMGNLGPGLFIDDLANDNFVAHNTIALNGQDGISLNQGVIRNTFTQNSIYSNGELGIDLNSGWGNNNNDIPYPVLSSGLGTTIQGTACPNCLVEVFIADPDPTGYGEGKEYLDYGYASSNGSFSILVSGPGFCFPVTATATDSDGNTSEFSYNINANCLHIGPLYLIPIWTFIIIVFGAIPWLLRRRRPSLSRWFIPLGALLGGLLFMPLVGALPFVEANLVPMSITCGDGVVEGGEQCDGDDLTMCLSGQVCKNCSCVTEVWEPFCGDGDVDGGEQCDGDDLSMCLSGQVCQDCNCVTVVGFCGNEVVDEGEQCDGDDLSMCLSGQVCDNCRCITMLELCGNRVVDESEQCDGDDLSMCLSGQVCENCSCVTHLEAQPEKCVYESLANANCRESDYPESVQMAIMTEGETAELVALNPEFTHGLFELESERQCWIWLGLLTGPENPWGTCNVDLIDPPDKPSVCQSDLNEEQCIAAGGEWVVGAAPYCICPEE